MGGYWTHQRRCKLTTHTVKTFEELQAIAEAGQLVLAVSGSPDLTALDVADISQGPPLADWVQEVREHGRTFVGIVALANGSVAAHLVEPLEVPAIEMLGAATVAHVTRRYLQAISRVGLASAPAPIESEAN